MIKTMELDELKNTWNELSSQAKENQIFDSKVFDKMSKRKFDASLAKIILPELLGSIVCIGSAVFIGVNFHKFDKAYLQIAAIAGVALFLMLPAISLVSIWQLRKAGDINQPYADTLKQFA